MLLMLLVLLLVRTKTGALKRRYPNLSFILKLVWCSLKGAHQNTNRFEAKMGVVFSLHCCISFLDPFSGRLATKSRKKRVWQPWLGSKWSFQLLDLFWATASAWIRVSFPAAGPVSGLKKGLAALRDKTFYFAVSAKQRSRSSKKGVWQSRFGFAWENVPSSTCYRFLDSQRTNLAKRIKRVLATCFWITAWGCVPFSFCSTPVWLVSGLPTCKWTRWTWRNKRSKPTAFRVWKEWCSIGFLPPSLSTGSSFSLFLCLSCFLPFHGLNEPVGLGSIYLGFLC